MSVFIITGCNEIKMVLSYRTPLYVEGTPKWMKINSNNSNVGPELLTNKQWKKIKPFDEISSYFAVQTSQKERVQILMKHHGVIDIYPNSLVAIESHNLKKVSIIQGKCSFIPLRKETIDNYSSLTNNIDRANYLEKLKKRYVKVKNGMLFIKNPLFIKTRFSSNIAKRGKTFSIIIDSNHLLEFSKFKLRKLYPKFQLINIKTNFNNHYRYMAVTGLDIYEHINNLHFSAAAGDLSGNWFKLRTYIPTAAFRRSLMKGKILSHGIKPKKTNLTFVKRFKKKLNILKKDPVFKRKYYRRLDYQNRQISFYWKSRRVFQKSRIIKKANKRFKKIYKISSPKKLWKGKFIVPSTGIVTSGFGHYRYYYGGHSSVHKGIDIASSVGTYILAPNEGKVVYTGHTPARGNNIIIDHGLGVYTDFFHLSEIFVKKGDYIKKGDIIATMGNSGLSSGSHLHWEMLVNGRFVNPLDWTKKKY